MQRKMAYMDKQAAVLDKELIRYQDQILTTIIRTLYDQMDTAQGVILNTTKNYRIMGEINKSLKTVEQMNTSRIGSKIFDATERIDQLSMQQFGAAVGLSEKLEAAGKMASRKIHARLGYVQDRLVKGGFIDSVLNADDIAAQANNLVTKAVAAQTNMKSMVSQLSELIDGGENLGLMERKFDRFAFDLYQQYDAAYNEQIADEADLSYFLYQGGLVEDSRDFCREHNNRVYSREEAEEWPEWTPAKAKFISTFKQKDIYSVPSYIDYAGYQPLIDRGGYNCRHQIGWISDELAFKLRPGLKES